MGQDADAGPVGGEGGVGPGVAAGGEGGDELVDEVRMGAAVAATLDERKVVRVLDRFREHPDRLRQQVGEVGDFDFGSDFVLRLLGRVEHVRLPFDEGPFEALLGAVDVEAFAVLPGDVVEERHQLAPELHVKLPQPRR